MRKHSKSCYLGGYRGPTACCGGKCLHKVNCNCKAGDTVDRAYLIAKISGLTLELESAERKLK